MATTTMTLEKLINGSKHLSTVSDNYRQSYREFIKYFKNAGKLNEHHIIIGAHMVYGWMPRSLNLDISNKVVLLKILNKARTSEIINEEELTVVKKSINNSLVGSSKLLHFINPQQYAIWDSHIYRIYTKNKSNYGIQSVKLYLGYNKWLHSLVDKKETLELFKNVKEKLGYSVSKLRALELVLFELGRKRKTRK
ncbi:hypothetical protein [Flavihumibacter sp.]|uniref:hypothetical protein n=1 Tax=Flavihumibacter sp. TaxID=1913981 RepID=UPI002FC6F4D8